MGRRGGRLRGRRVLLVAALCVVTLAIAAVAFAAAGQLDQSFSGDGKRTATLSAGTDLASAVAIQPNGRAVVVGRSDRGSPGGQEFAIARFMPNGNLDQSFSGDGKRTIGFANGSEWDEATGVAIQANGRIVVAGLSDQDTSADYDYRFALARFMPNGNLDQSFSGDGKRTAGFANGADDDSAFAIAIQPNGRILLAGFSDDAVSGRDFGLVRFMPNGTLDQSFSGDGRRTVGFGNGTDWNVANGVATRADGGIVAAGFSDQAGGSGRDFALARFHPNGSLVEGFSGDGKRTAGFGNGPALDEASAVAIQSNGWIVAAGRSDQDAGAGFDLRFAVARFHADGNVDQSFSGDGRRTGRFGGGSDGDFAEDVAIQPNGRIVVAGYSDQDGGPGTDYAFGIARLMAGGSLDQSFSGDGGRVVEFRSGAVDERAGGVAIQQNGRIVVAGFSDQATGYDFAVARLLGS